MGEGIVGLRVRLTCCHDKVRVNTRRPTMSIQPAWQHTLDFFGTPVVVEPAAGQLTSDAGLLPFRQCDEHLGLTQAFAASPKTSVSFSARSLSGIGERLHILTVSNGVDCRIAVLRVCHARGPFLGSAPQGIEASGPRCRLPLVRSSAAVAAARSPHTTSPPTDSTATVGTANDPPHARSDRAAASLRAGTP